MFSLKLCAKGFIKSAMCVMNGFCIVLAICLMGVSMADMQIVQKYAEEGAEGTTAASAVVICACALLVCVAGLGCLGAIKENSRFLHVYIVLLVTMVAMQMLLAVFTAVQRYGLEVRVVDWIRDDFYRNVTAEDADEHRRQWDRLQSTFMCCGVDGPDDYAALGEPVSLACCRTAYELKTTQGRQQHYELCLRTKSYEEDGCEDELLYALRESGDSLLSIAVIALLFECTILVALLTPIERDYSVMGSGMMMAMWLTNYLRNEVKVYKETLRY